VRVLVADDDATSRRMLTAALGSWGYEVVAAADGTEAWAEFQKPDPPHLALLDWLMPGLTGPELCHKLRNREPATPLYAILLTVKNEHSDVVEGLDTGADDFIRKPWDDGELRARLNVGRRMLHCQAAAAEQERLRGALEMAGAVCHEFNQPLQVIRLRSELVLLHLAETDPHYAALRGIADAVDRMGALTRDLMRVTRYESRVYPQGRIVDIHESSDHAA
jgi:phosphoserine phosphatase RsbU/P